MMEKLEKLRTKPDHVKRRIAFGVSFCVSLVILMFWVSSLTIASNDYITQGEADALAAASTSPTVPASPLNSFTASVFDAFSSLKGLFASSVTKPSDVIEIYAAGSTSPSIDGQSDSQQNIQQ